MTERALKRWTIAARWGTAIFFVAAGVNHFRQTEFYMRIVPPHFQHPRTLVIVSGWCEIAGGLGILFKALRRPAALGLIALLVAVFPANIFMAMHPEATPDLHVPPWALWVRLPLQLPLIALVWFAGFKKSFTT